MVAISTRQYDRTVAPSPANGSLAGLVRPEPSQQDFSAHLLRFITEVTTPVMLRAHKGSALRGAFFHALRNLYCQLPECRSCVACPRHDVCPICFLVATVDDYGQRGVEVPRPYVIQPPLDSKTDYQPGDLMSFDLLLFGQALECLPQVVQAIRRMGDDGLGRTRGCFKLREAWAVNPLSGLAQRVYAGRHDLMVVSDLPLTHGQVMDRAAGLSNHGLEVRLRTPLRLVNQERLVHQIGFATLFQRLLERLSALSTTYATQPLPLNYAELLTLARQVRVADDRTQWLDVDRYSTRQGRAMPMGGLVGRVRFEGDLEPFLPWLVWGEVVHVGKYTVMGNGWLELSD